MATYFITGASRGLGIEFVRQLVARGDRVLGGVRTQASERELKTMGAQAVRLDVTSAAHLKELHKVLGGEAVDVLINNAGVNSEAKRLEDLDAEKLREVFDINSIAP